MGKWSRSDVIQIVYESIPDANKANVEAIIKETLSVIANEVRLGNSVELKGFATFKPVLRAAKTGRNPATGETIQIPAHRACAVKAKFKMDA